VNKAKSKKMTPEATEQSKSSNKVKKKRTKKTNEAEKTHDEDLQDMDSFRTARSQPRMKDAVSAKKSKKKKQAHFADAEEEDAKTVQNVKSDRVQRAKSFKKGALIELFSLANKEWVDGEVVQVIKEGKGFGQLKPGSMKVTYDRGTKTRWVAPEERTDLLRPSSRPRPPSSAKGDCIYVQIVGWIYNSWTPMFWEVSDGTLAWFEPNDKGKRGKLAGSLNLLGLECQRMTESVKEQQMQKVKEQVKEQVDGEEKLVEKIVEKLVDVYVETPTSIVKLVTDETGSWRPPVFKLDRMEDVPDWIEELECHAEYCMRLKEYHTCLREEGDEENRLAAFQKKQIQQLTDVAG